MSDRSLQTKPSLMMQFRHVGVASLKKDTKKRFRVTGFVHGNPGLKSIHSTHNIESQAHCHPRHEILSWMHGISGARNVIAALPMIPKVECTRERGLRCPFMGCEQRSGRKRRCIAQSIGTPKTLFWKGWEKSPPKKDLLSGSTGDQKTTHNISKDCPFGNGIRGRQNVHGKHHGYFFCLNQETTAFVGCQILESLNQILQKKTFVPEKHWQVCK